MSRFALSKAPLFALTFLILAVEPARSAEPAPAPDALGLVLRSRVESPGLGGASRVIETPASWEPNRTAAIVCDMWDLHHCLNAVRREVDMAPRMNQLLHALRDRGVLIIHAPSGCMDAYQDHPARRRAQAVARAASLPEGIGQWCRQIPAEERAAYPVDQTDGGEDDDPAEHASWASRLSAMGRNPRAPWKSQTDLLTIDPDQDLISDDGEEIWSALEARGIGNVILMGVHTNMCVLGRPFGLRQMAKNGKRVVLMRDLTDTMYNPARAPFVSHFTGTDRVVEHIERFVCPTVTSDQVLGGRPFRFATDTRPRVVFLIAEDEYRTETTLPPFAATHLGRDFAVRFVFDAEANKNLLTGVGAIDEADVLVVSARRRTFPVDQLEAVRRHVAAGKAVVGIRTASHAFALRGDPPLPEGLAAWPEFDAEVLGGHYTNHHKAGPTVTLSIAAEGAGHPVLTGVDVASLVGRGSLYKVSPLAASARPLLIGAISGETPEPVAWTNLTARGGRVVYTSLGHLEDFAQPAFVRLLRNAIAWAAGLAVTERVETSSTDPIPFPR
jgi:nicotinamidase-related amidase/type 1 glutamine amidotransferase